MSGPTATELSRAFTNAQRYLLTTGFQTRYASDATQPYLDVLATNPVHEFSIRTPAAAAFALAVATGTGGYDPTATGVPAADALRYAVWLTRSVACAHRSVSGSGWGNEFESPLWAVLDGTAGWLLWPHLSPTDRGYVARMVATEADWQLTQEPQYQRDRNGRELTPGTCGCEKDAWRANVLELAAAMMPAHPHWRAWQAKAIQLSLAATTPPQEANSGQVINGRPLNRWIAGSTIEADGSVINHNRIHPEYLVSLELLDWTAIPLYELADQSAPAAVLHDGGLTWGVLVSRQFGYFPGYSPYAAPGGSMYDPDTKWVYYPEGDDWSPSGSFGPVADYAAADDMASVLPLNSQIPILARQFAPLHLAAQLLMQARGSDGRTYQAADEDIYYSREEDVARLLAVDWLTQWVISRQGVSLDQRPY